MSDVEMRTGAGLKGSILVMHRCLLLLFSVALVPLVLGFGTGKRQDTEPAQYVLLMALVCLCYWAGNESVQVLWQLWMV